MTEDFELFENSFHEWLAKHGLELGRPLTSPPFPCWVDLNELKVGIAGLIAHQVNLTEEAMW